MEKILVPIDLHEESSWLEIIPKAVDQARHVGAELYFLTVIPHVELNMPGVPVPEDLHKMLEENTLDSLEILVKDKVPDDLPVHCALAVGSVASGVIEMANEIEATLIIMASHRPGLRTYLLGANAAQVARHAKCFGLYRPLPLSEMHGSGKMNDKC